METRASALVREVTTNHVGTAALGCPVEPKPDSPGTDLLRRL